MKPIKVILFALICTLPVKSNGQVLLGLIFGDDLNTESLAFGVHLDQSWNNYSQLDDGDPLRSFNFGLFFSKKLGEHWKGNASFLPVYRRGVSELPPYSLNNQELDISFAEGRVARQVNYLSLPVTIQYVMNFGGFLEVGPQISYRTRARDLFLTTFEGNTLIYENRIDDEVARWDFGWIGGIGIYLGKEKLTALGVRYHGGFTDALKNQPGNQVNQQWAIFANIPIGRGKMKIE